LYLGHEFRRLHKDAQNHFILSTDCENQKGGEPCSNFSNECMHVLAWLYPNKDWASYLLRQKLEFALLGLESPHLVQSTFCGFKGEAKIHLKIPF
jgi:hypothetical protein